MKELIDILQKQKEMLWSEVEKLSVDEEDLEKRLEIIKKRKKQYQKQYDQLVEIIEDLENDS
jgi:chaperonin cofactor prefoldin